jgi:hypothetical protein
MSTLRSIVIRERMHRTINYAGDGTFDNVHVVIGVFSDVNDQFLTFEKELDYFSKEEDAVSFAKNYINQSFGREVYP